MATVHFQQERPQKQVGTLRSERLIEVHEISPTGIVFSCYICTLIQTQALDADDVEQEWYRFACNTCGAQRSVNLCKVVGRET